MGSNNHRVNAFFIDLRHLRYRRFLYPLLRCGMTRQRGRIHFVAPNVSTYITIPLATVQSAPRTRRPKNSSKRRRRLLCLTPNEIGGCAKTHPTELRRSSTPPSKPLLSNGKLLWSFDRNFTLFPPVKLGVMQRQHRWCCVITF